MKIDKDTIVKALNYPFLALTSIRFYFDVLFKLKGTGLLYLIALSLLVSIPASFKLNSLLDSFRQIELPNLIAQLPSSYLSKEGRLYPKDDNDSFKKIYTTDGVLAIIYNVNDGDYTEKLNSKNGYLPLVELGSYTLKIKSPKGEISSVKYTDLFPTSSDFNPLQASNLAQSVISLAKSIVFFVMAFWIFSILVFNTLILCFITKLLFTFVGKMNTNFTNTLRLCSYANTILAVVLLVEFIIKVNISLSYLVILPSIYILLFVTKFRQDLNRVGVEAFVRMYTPQGTRVKTYGDEPNYQPKKDLSDYVSGLDSTTNKAHKDEILNQEQDNVSKTSDNDNKDKQDTNPKNDHQSMFLP
ncbi:MAG: DUF1189 family protein [Succinivibrio sp.]|nr:DUF1189 family protein [Succinivibrio sp.]